MAEIPLRSYLHEIEKHIESGRTDQAIAHCRHILQSYPKYVDAYRLLGKAYLESQRYGDAGDIFQRVLSSVPDDFVSHVGMSIIREDEGNLDEAIWHMERGFEVQPSNNAIQEELRRLYGKRDHVEPPKIRLTRGALARMYYKGELYQQAIGEIRTTLADSPDRLDLQALLSDIYLKINQRVEAADAALAVLHRLPNCLVTIRVMIQVLSSTEREMEQKSYRQRLAQLDPYSVFAAIDAPSSDTVSEHALKLEKLDWKPDTSLIGEAGQPAWAASLGVDLGDLSPAKEDTLPDWLSGVSTEPGVPKEAEPIRSSAFAFDEAEPAPAGAESLMPGSSEEEIPDWLRQAGWGPSTGAGELAEAQQAAPGPELTEETGQPEDGLPGPLPSVGAVAAAGLVGDHLAGADMPDWLKAMAPAPGSPEQAPEPAEEEAEEEDVTPWLEKLIPPGSKAAQAASAEPSPAAAQPAAEEFPDWLRAAGPAAEEAGAEQAAAETMTPSQAEPAAGLPSWLTGAEEPVGMPEASLEPEAEPVEAETRLPDWLLKGEAIPEEELAGEPTWEAAAPAEAVPAGELPDWLMETQAATPEVEGEAPVAEPSVPSEVEAGLPDWLLKGEAIPEEELAGESTWETAAPAEAVPAGELPDWLMETQAATPEAEGEVPVVEPSAPSEVEAGLPDWLLKGEAIPEEELAAEPTWEAAAPAEAEPAGEFPDWLMETQAAAPEVEGEAPVVEPSAPSAAAAGLAGWLLKNKAIPEEELAGEPPLEAAVPAEAEPAGELPDWLKETQAATPEVESEPPVAEPATPVEAEAGLPDWLLKGEAIPEEELAGEPTWEAAAPSEAEPAGELPDWLLGVQAATPEVESEAPVAEPSTPVEAEAGLPDWLLKGEAIPEEELAGEPTWEAAAPAEAEPAGELPDWLLGVQAATPEVESEAPVAEPSAPAEAEAGLPDWLLKGEAIPEEELAGETTWEAAAPAEAEPAGELPDWLLNAQAAIPEVESEAPVAEPSASAEAEAGLPDWLMGVTLPEAEAAPVEPEPAVSEPTPAAELPTELPDWLLGVTLPEAEAAPAEPAPAEEPSAGLPDWLMEVTPSEAETSPAEPESAMFEPAPAGEPSAGLPDWLMDVTPSEVEAGPSETEPSPVELTSAAEPATELPDWLLEVAALDEKLAPVEPEAEPVSGEPAPASELPAWLFEAEEPVAGISGPEIEAGLPVAETGAVEAPQVAPAEELPDWLSQAESLAEEVLPLEPEPAAKMPAWLFETEESVSAQELEPEPAGEEPASEELIGEEPAVLAPEAAAAAELLDWLKEPTPAGEELAPLQAEPSTEMPEWLFETQEPASQAAEGEPGQGVTAELPEWLQEAAPTAQEPSALEAEPASEIPAWLFETEAESPALVISETQLSDTQPLRVKPAETLEPAEQPAAAPEQTPELDDAFAWLMGLSAEEAAQPAQAEPGLETVSALPETPFEEQPEPVLPVEPLQEELPLAELPLEPFASEAEAQVEPVEELFTTEPLVEPVAPEPTSAVSDLDADNAFAWLESLAVKQGANEALILKPEERLETMPDWVRQDVLSAEQAAPETPPVEPEAEAETPEAGVEEALPVAELELEPVEQPVAEPVEPELAPPEAVTDQDSAFAWLESLAVKQGANEALILKPEERLETMPDWVRQDALTAEQAAPETPPVEPEAELEALEAGVEETLPVAEQEPEPEAGVELVSELPTAVEEQAVVEQLPVVEEQPAVEQPVALAETAEEPAPITEEAPTPIIEEIPALEETAPAEPQPAAAEVPVAPPAAESASDRRGTAGLPDLPDWLKESGLSQTEELEWTPPPVPQRRYDLNQASLSELERLPGVGFIAAQQITSYRDAHGPFVQIDDLKKVPGIHSTMVRGIRDYLYVVEPEEPEPTPPELVIQLGAPAETGMVPELVEARAQLTGGEMPEALEKYAALIRSNTDLEHVIQDLQAAAYRFPTDINVWQQLGDACLRVDRVQDALQAFIKAEQLLN
jgi:competence ComEA-like helix-hairpin-helix protein